MKRMAQFTRYDGAPLALGGGLVVFIQGDTTGAMHTVVRDGEIEWAVTGNFQEAVAEIDAALGAMP